MGIDDVQSVRSKMNLLNCIEIVLNSLRLHVPKADVKYSEKEFVYVPGKLELKFNFDCNVREFQLVLVMAKT